MHEDAHFEAEYEDRVSGGGDDPYGYEDDLELDGELDLLDEDEDDNGDDPLSGGYVPSMYESEAMTP